MNILIVSDTLSYPPSTGGRIRIFNLIKRISKKHNVFLVALINSVEENKYVEAMNRYCSKVETALLKRRSKLAHIPGLIRCLLSGQPLNNKFVFLTEMKNKIKEIMDAQDIDIIQIEHSFMASYITAIPRKSKARMILDLHNIGFIQAERMFRVERNILRKLRILLNLISKRKWEPKFAANFDRCITTSDIDKETLKLANPKLDISVVPNGVDIDVNKPLPVDIAAKDIIFIGIMDYQPNIDAAIYFCKQIFPLVKKSISDCRLFIVGRDPVDEIQKLARDKGVIVTGYVEDVIHYYKMCALSVVPLRAGGGTRLKILEAMALGVPVVSTSIGCEGIQVVSGENILIADKPEEFAAFVGNLISDLRLRERISKNGRKLVEQLYSWDKAAEDLIQIYAEIIRQDIKD